VIISYYKFIKILLNINSGCIIEVQQQITMNGYVYLFHLVWIFHIDSVIFLKAEKYGAHGWAWKDLEPYFRKAENFTPSSKWPISTKGHGRGGPWQISYPSYTSPILPPFIFGCNSIGIPTVPDINHSQTGMIGVTRVQTFIDSDGRRSSAATAYLTEDVCRRENLKISVGMTVVRIITHTAAGSKPVARGVELASGPCVSIRYRVKATRDIIIACGTVHTPQLLKLSGIGPESELTQHDIKVVKDLPGVGANLQVNEL
jgi:choline dehydrogenase